MRALDKIEIFAMILASKIILFKNKGGKRVKGKRKKIKKRR